MFFAHASRVLAWKLTFGELAQSSAGHPWELDVPFLGVRTPLPPRDLLEFETIPNWDATVNESGALAVRTMRSLRWAGSATGLDYANPSLELVSIESIPRVRAALSSLAFEARRGVRNTTFRER